MLGPVVIELDPVPPKQGQSLKITFSPNSDLVLEWDHDAPIRLSTDANGNLTVLVPDNATSLIVSDPSPNGAKAVATVIDPC